jgi:hypothetical protein
MDAEIEKAAELSKSGAIHAESCTAKSRATRSIRLIVLGRPFKTYRLCEIGAF